MAVKLPEPDAKWTSFDLKPSDIQAKSTDPELVMAFEVCARWVPVGGMWPKRVSAIAGTQFFSAVLPLCPPKPARPTPPSTLPPPAPFVRCPTVPLPLTPAASHALPPLPVRACDA